MMRHQWRLGVAEGDVFLLMRRRRRRGEKASAFERMYARKQLKIEAQSLEDDLTAKDMIEKHFSFIDFAEKKIKNSGIILSYLPDSKEKLTETIVKKQKKMMNHSLSSFFSLARNINFLSAYQKKCRRPKMFPPAAGLQGT